MSTTLIQPDRVHSNHIAIYLQYIYPFVQLCVCVYTGTSFRTAKSYTSEEHIYQVQYDVYVCFFFFFLSLAFQYPVKILFLKLLRSSLFLVPFRGIMWFICNPDKFIWWSALHLSSYILSWQMQNPASTTTVLDRTVPSLQKSLHTVLWCKKQN